MFVSLAKAKHLLSVEKSRKTLSKGRVKIFPLVAACGNIFLCGFFDQYLQGDSNGHYLRLFLLIQVGIRLILSVGYYKQSTEEILTKAQIFPLSFWDRFYFILLGNLTRSLSLIFLLTSSLFFIVFYHQSLMTVIVAVLFLILLVVCVEILIASVFLLVQRSPHLAATGGLVILFLFFCTLVSSTVFHFETALNELPIVSWAAAGINAVLKGKLWSSSLSVMYFIITSIVAVVFTRKYA
jgi:hypothetical protein